MHNHIKIVMKKSFSLIEVVIACVIITLFLGALIALFNVGSKSMVTSKHRLQAGNLARRSIEAARFVRDNAWLSGTTNWLDASSGMSADCNLPIGISHLHPDCNGRIGFKIGAEKTDTTIDKTLCPPTCDGVTFDSEVNIANISDQTKRVVATVSWDDFGTTHQVRMSTFLTDWKKK